MADLWNANLTPEQRLIAAHAHLCLGIDIQKVAVILLTNHGRISEAVQAVRIALVDPKGVVEAMSQGEDPSNG